MSGILPTIQNVLDNINVGILYFGQFRIFSFCQIKLFLISTAELARILWVKQYKTCIERELLISVFLRPFNKTKRPVTQIQTSVSVKGELRERLSEVSPHF